MSEAEAIARALNARKMGARWVGFCPAHDDRRKPSLSISEGDGGRTLLTCFAGCHFTDIRGQLVARGIISGSGDWTPPDPEEARRRDAARAADRAKRVARSLALWNTGRKAEGSLVARYLGARGIRLPAPPDVLRFHPAVPHPAGRDVTFPAMLARVDGSDSAFLGLHRTYLRPDGSGKAEASPDKAALGPIAGGAVRLRPAGPKLAVGEGIESTLSFMVATGVPAWAALSTSGLRALVLPALPLAAELVIAADHDPAGLAAADALAERARAEGRRVVIVAPPAPGDDFNDLARR